MRRSTRPTPGGAKGRAVTPTSDSAKSRATASPGISVCCFPTSAAFQVLQGRSSHDAAFFPQNEFNFPDATPSSGVPPANGASASRTASPPSVA